MERLIFLDLDGVLNYVGLYDRPHDKIGDFADLISVSAVEQLNRITDSTGADIVVSSTWRHQGRDYVVRKLRHAGVRGRVIDVTGSLPQPWAVRGNEIRQWLEQHRRQYGVRYVIIDDDSDMLADQLKYFVNTDGWHGLQECDAELAIRILRGEDVGGIR